MLRQFLTTAFGLSALFMALIALNVQASAQQPENTVVCVEAPGITPLNYGDNTSDCAVDTQTDLDQFSFSLAVGTSIRINVLGLTNNLDPRIEVRDPNGTVIADDNCFGGQFSICSFSTDLDDLLTPGTYQIAVSDAGTDNLGDYQISLNCLAGSCPGLPTFPVLSYDDPVSDTLSPHVDMDFFNFEGAAGTSIRFNVLGLTNNLDPRIEVRDPAGVVVADNNCPGGQFSICSFSTNLDLVDSGTYQVAVSDAGINNLGDYQISLNCLVGSCPGAPTLPALSYDFPVSDTLSPHVDMDIFAFEGAAGTSIRFNVLGLTNNLDPRIEVRDPGGNVIADDSCSGGQFSICSFSTDLNLVDSGTYQVAVSDAGTNNLGNYQISLNCFGSGCPIVVPPVVGLPQADAEGAIVAALLTVGTVTTASSNTVPAGNVISQNPTGGTVASIGDPVDLVISTGPPTVTVPDVVNLCQPDPEAAIIAAGLTVGTVTMAPSNTVPAGCVISQNPAGGSTASLGDPVDLVISTGPPMVTVPPVVGLSQAVAEAAIVAAGLTVGTVTMASSNTVPAGNVISQIPVGGTNAALGDPVDLMVSTGPIVMTVPVPNVTGLSQAAAEAAIVVAGLTVGAVTTAESDNVPAGDVISQSPAGGSRADPGDPVDLVVSAGPSAAPSPVLAVIEDVEVDNDWTPVVIPQSVGSPVVIAGTPSSRNTQPGLVRLRNLAPGRVEARFQEWRYLDDEHPGENLALLALSKGRHKMADGSIWEVGVLKVRNNRNWKRKKFKKRFRKRPEVFLTVQSNRDETPVTVRARNVTKRSFEAALLEEERDLKTGHPKETVGYLAVFSKKRKGTITDDLGPLPYRLKRAKLNDRFKKVLGELLRVEEERSQGRETKHGKETVSTLVVGDGVFAQQITDREPDTTTIRRREP